MIADVLSNKKRNQIATELFFRRRKLNISLVFLFCCIEDYMLVYVRLKSTHYFIIKIPNK